MHLASFLPTLSTSNKCNHFESICLEGGVFVFWFYFLVVSFSCVRATLFIAAHNRRVYIWSEEKGFESHEL